jgi:hypothetical protein
VIHSTNDMTPCDLVPASFLGGPLALLLPAMLVHMMPLWLAFIASALAGLAGGLSILRELRKPAPQRRA